MSAHGFNATPPPLKIPCEMLFLKIILQQAASSLSIEIVWIAIALAEHSQTSAHDLCLHDPSEYVQIKCCALI